MIKSRLKVLLAEKEKTQLQLGRDTGIRQATISEIANNQAKHIPLKTLETLCEYFDCQPGDILQRVKDDSK